MDVQIMLCGYSFHAKKWTLDQSKGLQTYFFRLQTEGHAKVLLNGSWEPVAAGDLFLYKPGEPFAMQVDEEKDDRSGEASSGDYYVYCKGDWLDQWWNERSRPRKTRIHMDERLLQLWRQLILEKRRLTEENVQLSAYLLKALCLTLDRAIADKAVYHRRTFTAARMRTYVEEHATKPFKVSDVARHASLSVSRAAALYKECFGKTIIQHAMEIRLSIALERMAYSKLTFEQIAETSGFGSYAYFHRVFRDKFGVSPSRYMELQRV